MKALDTEILTSVGDADLEDEISQADIYKKHIFATLILREKATTSAPTTTAGVLPTTVSTPTHSNKVRLPKLTMHKPFNGKLTAWSPFWDSYSSAIHDNPDITKVDKFNYLMSMEH